MVSNDKKKTADVKRDFGGRRVALILAGGKSSRMGRDKAQLPFGGTTVIEFLMARLRKVCEEVIIVARPEQTYTHPHARVVFDVVPGKFGLGGLYSGLLQSPAEINFVCACDMPLIAPALVEYLFTRLPGFDAVVPRIEGQAEPLCAIYAKTCLPALQERLRADDLRLSGWLAQVNTCFVEKHELQRYDARLRSFTNLNTSWDYERQLAYLQEETAAACI